MVDINNINNIAVIGAGTMGREIAQVALMAGFKRVILNDIKNEALESAAKYIENGLKKLEKKGKLKDNITAGDLMNNLVIESNLKKSVENADFIIEAVPEIMKIKQEVFKELGIYAPKHAILATNTSNMRVTHIAIPSGRPDKVVGMHFFIPVVVLRLIEIIKGERTSEETMEIALEIGKKFPSTKGDRYLARIEKETPGFIVNRLTAASSIYLNWLLEEADKRGISYEQIDTDVIALQGGGMGPYAKWDYLGLDVIYHSFNYFAQTLSPDFAPGKILTKFVNDGLLGRKTGKGFYEWTEDRNPVIKETNKAGLFDFELFMAIQLNEGCKLLEEGVVKGFQNIDNAMLAGMDMPGPFGPGKKNYRKWTQMLEEFAEISEKKYLKPCELMKTGEFIRMRK